MPPSEIIISGSSSEASTSAAPGRATAAPAIQTHDLHSGTHLRNFKTSTSSSNSTAYVRTRDCTGGALMAVQENQALLNVWAWSKDQLYQKIHLPEKLSSFSVSPKGIWAAGGSPSGQLYLWEISSGLLLATWPAHYRSVASLIFTNDSRVLLSASLDSSVHVYLVSRLIDDDEERGVVGRPYGSLNDHTLRVTAVAVGRTAGAHGGRCWTASEDGTVKVWSLHPTFDLLTTFALPQSIVPSTLVVDPTERFFYVGTTAGDVHLVPLYRHRAGFTDKAISAEMDVGAGDIEAVGGGGQGSASIKVSPSLISVKSPITAISLSLSSTHLLIGTHSGDIHLFSLPSHQHLRTLSTHSRPISHLSTLLRPPDLAVSGPSSSSAGAGARGRDRGDDWPIMEIKPFERVRATRQAKDTREVGIVINNNAHRDIFDSLLPPKQASVAVMGSAGTDSGRIAELESENKRLRTNLEKATKINDKMWAGVVQMKMGEMRQ